MSGDDDKSGYAADGGFVFDPGAARDGNAARQALWAHVTDAAKAFSEFGHLMTESGYLDAGFTEDELDHLARGYLTVTAGLAILQMEFGGINSEDYIHVHAGPPPMTRGNPDN